jgi:hypothetical protein
MNTLKNLPPWAQSLIALAIMAGGALGIAWQAAPPVPRAVAIIGSFCAVIGGALGVGLIKMRSLLPVGLAAGLAVGPSGCGYATAAKIVLGARDAGDAIAKGMAAHTRKVTADCSARCKAGPPAPATAPATAPAPRPERPAGTSGLHPGHIEASIDTFKTCYRACVNPWRVHRERFRTYGAAAISSAIAAGYMAIKLAKDAKQGSDKALEIARGVICVVSKAAEPFLPLIPEAFRGAASLGLAVAGKVACDE